MMKLNNSWSARETRLIARGNLRQLGRDIRDFHIRADDPLAAAGSLIMAPTVGVLKFGNALAGELSSEPAQPLPEGGMKYVEQDVGSIKANVFAAANNLIHGHPVLAAGNVIKGTFDAADILTDPLIDVGSGLFGHQNRKTREAFAQTLAA